MLLVDYEIRFLSILKDGTPCPFPLINPFSEAVSGNGVISYGLSSAGYDLRLGTEILVFKNSYGEFVDPKRFSDEEYRKRMFDCIIQTSGSIVIPAHGYILGTSLEYIRIPRNLKGRCTGKSTLARSGIIINTTPLEPEWEGFLTIEISNSCPCPALIYISEGIAQLEFEELCNAPEVSYKDKKGIYQNQVGVTPSRTRI